MYYIDLWKNSFWYLSLFVFRFLRPLCRMNWSPWPWLLHDTPCDLAALGVSSEDTASRALAALRQAPERHCLTKSYSFERKTKWISLRISWNLKRNWEEMTESNQIDGCPDPFWGLGCPAGAAGATSYEANAHRQEGRKRPTWEGQRQRAL